MAALTSLTKVSATSPTLFRPFFVAVSEAEPFISHANALVNTLDDSDPEKPYFRAFVGLARAISLHYVREEFSDDFAHDIRNRLIRLLYAYRYVVYCSGAQASRRLR